MWRLEQNDESGVADAERQSILTQFIGNQNSYRQNDQVKYRQTVSAVYINYHTTSIQCHHDAALLEEIMHLKIYRSGDGTALDQISYHRTSQ